MATSLTDISSRSSSLFDPYTFRARLQPALMTLFPLAVGMFAWTGGQWPWASTLWGLFGMVGGTFFLAVLARRSGRAIEPQLWKSWGGAPTTQILRHRGSANPLIRARWHKALATLLGSTLPTAEEENADPSAADLAYEAATRVAIGKTRDARAHVLVFKENVAYGFCRNLYALRRCGVFAALFGLALAMTAVWRNSRNGAAQLVPWVCLVLNVCALFLWLLYVNADSVKIPAFAYAERLFEAIDAPAPTKPLRKKS